MNTSNDKVAEAWSYALLLLRYRERSEQELSQRLARRGYDAAAITATIAKLRGYGLADDRRYAQLCARAHQQRHASDQAIIAALLKKGIDRAIIQDTLAEPEEGISELERARAYCARRRRGTRVNRKEYTRLGRALARRGFASAVIYEALGRPPADDADDAE